MLRIFDNSAYNTQGPTHKEVYSPSFTYSLVYCCLPTIGDNRSVNLVMKVHLLLLLLVSSRTTKKIYQSSMVFDTEAIR